MKKNKLLLITCFVFICNANAETKKNEIVFNVQPPENCIEQNINKKKLSLIDLIKIGICTNPSLNNDYMSIKIAESQLKQIKSEYLPEINANLNGSSSKTKLENNNRTHEEPYSGNLSLSWMLYDFGGRSSNVKKAYAYLDSSKYLYSAKLQETILSIHTSYLKLLGSKEVLKSAEENEKAFKKSFEESSKKYKLGMASLNDKLQAKTQYEQSILKTVEAKNNVEQYQGDLATILNLSPDTRFDLIDPPTDKDITELEFNGNINEMIKTALEARPEIKEQESNVKYNLENIESVKADRMPTIYVDGKISYSDDSSNDGLYNNDSQISLNLLIPLFSGFETTNKISQAKYEYKKAQYSLDTIKNNIKNEVWSAYQDYKTSVESYRISKQILESAEENLKVAFRSYEVGKTDILNLLTANSNLADAKQGKVNAFYKVLINKANLYKTIGRIK